MRYILLSLFILTSCAQKEHKPKMLMAFGDSFTHGTNDITFLDQLKLNPYGSIKNNAVSGTVIDQQYDVIMSSGTDYDAVIMISGINDARIYGLAGLENYKSKLDQLFQYWNLINKKVFIGTCPRLYSKAYVSPYLATDEVMDAYADALQSIAINYTNVVVVDLNEHLTLTKDLVQQDNLHPNYFGAGLIAEQFDQVLSK